MELKKETIEQLCKNTSSIIKVLTKSLREEILVETILLDASVKNVKDLQYLEMLQIAYALRVGCTFSQIDIGALLLSDFRAKTSIEKRFLMNNVHASIAESFKLGIVV